MNRAFLGGKSVLLWLTIVGSTFSQYHRTDDILFDGPVNYGNYSAFEISSSSSRDISPEEAQIRLAQEFNEIQTIDDLLNKLEDVPVGGIFSRFGNGERSSAVIPKRAGCIPENKTISLSNNSKIITFPDCTRVPRCGGCCTDVQLSCQPTSTVTRNFEIILIERTNGRMKFKGKEIVPVEEHTACTCGCKTQAEHCNEKQVYKAMECRCACTNLDEQRKCIQNNRTKEWNSKTCSCKCRGWTECTSGAYYDHNTCSCKLVTTASRRRYPTGEKDSNSPSYRFDSSDNSDYGNSGQSPIIYTINSEDPRRRHKEDPE